MKFRGFTISFTHLEWGDYYWLYWWNWLYPGDRYFGYHQDYYDGPMSGFGMWFFNITWRLPWTRHDGGFLDKE